MSVVRRGCGRTAVVVAALVGGVALAAPVFAQSWPSKPVRMVLPMPPGSGSDLVARSLAQRLSTQWGQPVVIDNRPGAGTIVGTETVARAAPDGHTLLFGIDLGFTVAPHLQKVSYDPLKDLQPITLIAAFASVMVANPSVPAANLRELIALAKAEPGKLAYGTLGAGSGSHLLTEMLNHRADLKLLHVPYKGAPQLTTAVLSGEVPLAWSGVFSMMGHVKAGKLKALAYGGDKRSKLLPDVPTLVELGYADVEYSVWYGLFAPGGTARPLVNRIHADVAKQIADPAFGDKELLARGYDPSGLGPDEFAALIRREFASRAVMVKVSGAKAE
jgi:tripartite-type tricarboxylate transporter receptor subunit TctC